jgi:hypothetical protein
MGKLPADGISATGRPRRGEHSIVGRLDGEGARPIAAAERVAAQISTQEHPLGPPGPRFNWRSPFFVGLTASAGVAVTYGVVRGLAAASSMLLLIGVAFFVALGLEPAVSWLVGKKLPRWAAVTVVIVAVIAVVAGSFAAAIPPLLQQARQFIDHAPHYMQQLGDHSSWIGRLNERFHLQQRITETLNGSGGPVLGQAVKAGTAVFSSTCPGSVRRYTVSCLDPVGHGRSSSETRSMRRWAHTCSATLSYRSSREWPPSYG